MKIAFLTARPPYPLNTGGRIRTFHLLKETSRVEDVALLTPVESRGDEEALAGIREALPRLTIRAVKVPSRRALLRRGARIVRSPVDPLPYTWAAYRDPRLTAHVRSILDHSQYDVVHCDHVQVAHVFSGIKTPPRLLNAHNVESVILRRVAENESSPWKRALITWQHLKTVRAEALAHRSFDRSVVVSEVDRAELEMIAPGRRVSLVPNGVDLEYFEPAAPAPDPHLMVFTGGMDWLPNIDGINFFASEVLPRIRKSVPGAELWVVGRNPSPSFARRLAGQGIRVTGTVDDVRPYVARAQLVVVPLRIGGGTRLKILEAWAMAKPVLSTSIGAEGLPAIDAENIAVADTPEHMARAAVALLDDRPLAARLGAAGRHVVEDHFSWRRIAARLLEAYDEMTVDGRVGAGSR